MKCMNFESKSLYQQKLLQRREELQKIMNSADESARPVELDQTMQGRLSRMDAIQQQQMALASKSKRALELKKIEAALQRIENDEFGYCLECGEEISEKRLSFDPTVLTCIECAE